ncbi:undecaprenyl-diphosphate phosphatase [Lactovum miscens]|uniref:Undecaprenyl-diphosphatase n=1 Tax=Lactovum miscens TaxID=190387 RepID=A0A841C8R8_9LACT|nr:undecaprenyl-diphosphate phosphatase [Lactovum miscens]MBB5887951.1 undecaprenyl-diphosphatase [Lactovum miscens]
MDIIKAFVLGIVEGVTEWLPISSTGHLIIVESFWGLNQSAAFKAMFDVVIQLGAILSVLVIYFHKLNPFSRTKSKKEVQHTWQLWAKVLIACIPAAVIGLPLNDWLDANFNKFVPVAIMLIIYGVAFIVVERYWVPAHEFSVTRVGQISYKMALIIGGFQVLSLIPGTSRSGATIVGALLLGISRAAGAEFSFFLGIPVMIGASGLKIVKYFTSGNSIGFYQILILLIAFVVAFIVSMFTIRWLIDYVKKHDFTFFGKYRIALGLILIMIAIIIVVTGGSL